MMKNQSMSICYKTLENIFTAGKPEDLFSNKLIQNILKIRKNERYDSEIKIGDEDKIKLQIIIIIH